MKEADADPVRALHHGLVEMGKLREELSTFRRHFDRLPLSYFNTRYMWPKPEDVLLDRRVLADADANKCIAVHARFIDRVPLHCVNDSFGFGGPPEVQPTLPDLRQDEKLIHEIIFASRDKPGLLSQLSAVMNWVSLHIREAHIFTTMDGFCLSIFHVDGWSEEDVKGLIEAIKDAQIRETTYIA